MKNLIIVFIFFLILFTVGCKRASVYYSLPTKSYNHSHKNLLNHSIIKEKPDVIPAHKTMFEKQASTISSKPESGHLITSSKDKEKIEKFIEKKFNNDPGKKKKNDGMLVLWIIFFILLTGVIAGLFYLLHVIFPGLGITLKRVVTYILVFYALIFLLVMCGRMPKEPQNVAPVPPCQEVKCPSYGCENGRIFTSHGDITCIRCGGKGTICK